MPIRPDTIQTGKCYSNGAYGRTWGVRQVLELSLDDASGEETVAFKGLAGTCRRKTGLCTLAEFARWAKYEVQLNETSWQRVGFFDDEPETLPAQS
ncbi:MAG: hypothetical protein AB1697_10965 [Pseudomonadota bacterium]